MRHLWESSHPYYCTEGNFFGNGGGECPTIFNYESWNEFLDGWGKSEPDLNLLFRWDWRGPHDPDWEIERDELHLYFMLQRKGYHASIIIKVEQSDEDRIREWLMPRLAHLMTLWEPLMETRPIVRADGRQCR